MTKAIVVLSRHEGLCNSFGWVGPRIIMSLCIGLLSGCAGGRTPFGLQPPGQVTSGTMVPILISAGVSQLRLGESTIFKATQTGEVVTGGTWGVAGGDVNGTITDNGAYESPANFPPSNQITIDFTEGGTTYTGSLTLLNPLPRSLAASPATLTETTTALTISGTGFVPGALVKANGTPLQTTFINSSTLLVTFTLTAGVTSPVVMTVTNPDPGSATSADLSIPVNLPKLSVVPAVLQGGSVSLTVSGTGFTAGSIVTMDGKPLTTLLQPSGVLIASGYLPPWKSGASTIAVAPNAGSQAMIQTIVPIAPTAVPYDTASRFATQAAFGPREDVIEHIQQVGLAPFITEQISTPGIQYSPDACCGPRKTFLDNATSGNSLLRARVSWALQTFIVQRALYLLPTLIPWQQKMERDAFGSFRQVLLDTASDTSMALFLSLSGNVASADPNVHPNQNFARELMQLFSIGDVLLNDDGSVQVDSSGAAIPSYSQATVLDLSRVFTGWNVDTTPDPTFTAFEANYSMPLVANEAQHDHGEKTLFGTTVLPAGQDAATDRAMALDAIFNHQNVPPYVSRILIQRLVKSSPSPAYVSRISAVFKDDGTGTRGNLAAVVRAILLDPEARIGDTTPTADDGFLQEPLLFLTFGMNLLGITQSDGQPTYIPGQLGEEYDYASTVFGYYGPTYKIPGTDINSPEFALLNDVTMIRRSQYLWEMVVGGQGGFPKLPSYLYTTFTNVPDLVEALNHLLYHGRMTAHMQNTIITYCSSMDPSDKTAQFNAAVFLAANADSYNVSR